MDVICYGLCRGAATPEVQQDFLCGLYPCDDGDDGVCADCLDIIDGDRTYRSYEGDPCDSAT